MGSDVPTWMIWTTLERYTMNSKSWSGVAFLACATLSFASTLGRLAEATPTVRLPATGCVVVALNNSSGLPNGDFQNREVANATDGGVGNANGRMLNTNTSTGTQAFCPIVSEISSQDANSFDVQRNLITGLAVDGYDGSSSTADAGQYRVHSCIVFGNGTQVICSAAEKVNGGSTTYTGLISNFVSSTTIAPLANVATDTTDHIFWYGTVIVTIPINSSLVGLYYG
jgi:hypothetical protein